MTDPKPSQDQVSSIPPPNVSGVRSYGGADSRALGSKATLPLEAREEKEATKEARRLDLKLKEIEVQLGRAKLRNLRASAKIKEQEAARLEAVAEEAQHRATKEPRRQTQVLAAGWVRIFLTVIASVFSLSMLTIGYLVTPLGYPTAVVASLCLYPLRPWEFRFPSSQPVEDDES